MTVTRAVLTPRERQRLVALVRTATSTGSDAVAAWHGLPVDFDLDEIWDRELARLLPAVGRSLRDAGYDDPVVPRLRGMQRKTWVEHQLLAASLAPWLDALAAAGVEVWPVGGALLAQVAWAHGDEPGIRWVDDTALAVRPHAAERAVAVLAAAGATTRAEPRVRRRLRLHAGLPVELDGRWIDLVWQPAAALPASTEWWRSGSEVTLGERPVRALDPAVATVVSCLRLVSGPAGADTALDLCRLLRNPAIDRRDVDGFAAHAGATAAVEDARRLVARIGDHQDDEWVDRLRPQQGRMRARAAWWTTSTRLGAGRAILAAPELLAERWHLDHVSGLPGAFVTRLGDRARRRRGQSSSPAR